MTVLATPSTTLGSDLRGLGPLLRLTVRRYRLRLACWLVPIIGLVAVTAPSYKSAYPDLASRASLVDSLRGNDATKVLYGQLPLPGTLGQLAQWEMGTYVILLTAVMTLTLAVSMTRVDEDQGRAEVVATAGLGRWTPTTTIAMVLIATNAILGLGAGLVLALQAVGSTEMTVAGAAAFGLVVAMTGIGVGATTLVVSELFWDASSTRRAAWAVLAAAFAARVGADLTPWHWLRAVTWFGIKDAVAPYTHNNAGPLVAAAMVSAALFTTAFAARSRREFGAGLLAPVSHRPRRLAGVSPSSLIWRLNRGSLLLWCLPVAGIAALFGGMSHALITLVGTDSATGSMFDDLSSATDPVRQYFSFSYVFIGLLPMVYGVLAVLRACAEERSGLLDTELATGIRRAGPLLARIVLAVVGSIVLLVVGAAMQAALTYAVADGGTARWALAYPLAQAPGILAAIGIAAAAVGWLPRQSSIVWAVVAWSAFTAVFAELLRLPAWARSFSLLGHGPDAVSSGVSGWMPWTAVAMLIVVAVIGIAAGLAGMKQRDIVAT
ncbi:hypothetical protein [uncultured Gordonia sp.]|uniref:hypothetical protein n=1 Tax=uncultured Gordonia sp. TaxID=198437 RepID=UPI000F94A61F|nr:hypothetical protein [uncultured Gordonia sp.]RUP37145.1 MAG: hypothetical protein EKK60_13215 [Gordonia sp. (in: high G+C Gram-positive bacteria)]